MARIKKIDNWHLEIKVDGIPKDEEVYADLLKIDELTEDDYELKHRYADEYLCQLLTNLGYPRGVRVFWRLPKWYA